MPATKDSTSQSSNATTGALPPSSRCVRLTSVAAARMACMPVPIDPVTQIMRTRALPVSSAPTEAPNPCTMFTTPAGKSCASLTARRRAVRGVSSLGLSTTVQPAARAGASLQLSSIRG
eukprot:Amastigsp_a176310_44.p4 type:complete len:119 gc:universal Amastigsp_a176310_44:867-511(-)